MGYGQQPQPPQQPQQPVPPMDNGQNSEYDQQEEQSEQMPEGADEYEDDAAYAAQGLPPDNGNGEKTYSSGSSNGNDNWLSIPSENDADEAEQSVPEQPAPQDPIPPNDGQQ